MSTAATPAALKSAEFVALYRPHRSRQPAPRQAQLKPVPGGYVLKAEIPDGRVLALLPSDDSATLTAENLTAADLGVGDTKRRDEVVGEVQDASRADVESVCRDGPAVKGVSGRRPAMAGRAYPMGRLVRPGV